MRTVQLRSARTFLAAASFVLSSAACGCSAEAPSPVPPNDAGSASDGAASGTVDASGEDGNIADGDRGAACWTPAAAYFNPTNVVVGDCSYHFDPPTKIEVTLSAQRAATVILGPTNATTFRGNLACDGPSTLVEDPDTTPGHQVTGTVTLSPRADGTVSVALTSKETVNGLDQSCAATFSMSP